MQKIGRAVKVVIDVLTGENRIGIYDVVAEVEYEDETPHLTETDMFLVRHYSDVSKSSLARIATLMAESPKYMMEGQAAQIRQYLNEYYAKLN